MSGTLRERIMHIISETSGCGCCAPSCPEEYLTEAKGWREGWQADQIIEAATPAIAAKVLRDAADETLRAAMVVYETAIGDDWPTATPEAVADWLRASADLIEAQP